MGPQTARILVALAAASSAAAFSAPAAYRAPRRAAACAPARHAGLSLRMGASVEQVSAEQFELALQTESGPMIVDFFTTWCGPCKLIAPQLEKVAAEYEGKVTIMKIDTDIEADLASTLQVYAMPTLLFIKDGKIRQRAEGAMLAPKIKDLTEHIFFDGPAPEWEWLGKVCVSASRRRCACACLGTFPQARQGRLSLWLLGPQTDSWPRRCRRSPASRLPACSGAWRDAARSVPLRQQKHPTRATVCSGKRCGRWSRRVRDKTKERASAGVQRGGVVYSR